VSVKISTAWRETRGKTCASVFECGSVLHPLDNLFVWTRGGMYFRSDIAWDLLHDAWIVWKHEAGRPFGGEQPGAVFPAIEFGPCASHPAKANKCESLGARACGQPPKGRPAHARTRTRPLLVVEQIGAIVLGKPDGWFFAQSGPPGSAFFCQRDGACRRAHNARPSVRDRANGFPRSYSWDGRDPILGRPFAMPRCPGGGVDRSRNRPYSRLPPTKFACPIFRKRRCTEVGPDARKQDCIRTVIFPPVDDIENPRSWPPRLRALLGPR